MPRDVERVVVLGANGAMGAGSGETFAAAGIHCTFLARDRAKAEAGRDRAEQMAKSEVVGKFIDVGTYDDDLARTVADADLVFEAVAEDLAIKKTYFEQVDEHRKDDAIVATVSSGLSIADMAAGRSESFQQHFLGMHLFNPPNVIVGCEVIPHAGTDPVVLAAATELLQNRLGREVVETADLPAFCGNRVGFKVLNEVAQLAEEHGVEFIDGLVGPHTGRAMPPLATVDLVGWDVHQAIVDNVHANTNDEAHDAFALPGYMKKLIDAGHLGNKTPAKGGFFRREGKGKGKDAKVLVLDPKAGDYAPAQGVELPDFVRTMQKLHRTGRYEQAIDVFLEAKGAEADLLRKVILGYVAYGLNRVGEVVREPRDVDRIMGFGFNWAPPTVLVDLMGAKRTIDAMKAAGHEVPAVVEQAASSGEPMFREPNVDRGRFFVGAA